MLEMRPIRLEPVEWCVGFKTSIDGQINKAENISIDRILLDSRDSSIKQCFIVM